MTGKHGFTLIELMIVVAVIAIIAAIAIPSLLNAKMAANEASAIKTLRSISVACVTYRTKNPSFPANLTTLVNDGLLDPILTTGVKSGYCFGTAGSGGDGSLSATDQVWSCYAEPLDANSGRRHFRVDHSNVLEVSTNGGGSWAPLD
jgi:type IV pilus assembly protein PilA